MFPDRAARLTTNTWILRVNLARGEMLAIGPNEIGVHTFRLLVALAALSAERTLPSPSQSSDDDARTAHSC